MIYTAYYQTLECSRIIMGENLEELKSKWCIGMAIFTTPELNRNRLRELFPDKPEIGTILKWFRENYTEIYQEGALIPFAR